VEKIAAAMVRVSRNKLSPSVKNAKFAKSNFGWKVVLLTQSPLRVASRRCLVSRPAAKNETFSKSDVSGKEELEAFTNQLTKHHPVG
jgi:hypothetical protein